MHDAAPAYETLILSYEGRVLTITLNRPDALNAVNLAMHDELAQVFQFAAADPASDVIILTGAGRAFSAGGDLDHLQRNADNPALFDHEIEIAKRIVMSMLDLDKPLLCRMNGHAVGLGATLALLCDVVFAAEGAKIGDPHVAIGLAAGDGGAAIWPARVGYGRAKEYLLTGQLLSAPEAERIGLVNYAMPLEKLDDALRAYCLKLAAAPPLAVRATKRIINIGLKQQFEAVLGPGLALERETVRTRDHREAIAAMREKRPPKFTGA